MIESLTERRTYLSAGAESAALRAQQGNKDNHSLILRNSNLRWGIVLHKYERAGKCLSEEETLSSRLFYQQLFSCWVRAT
jgi:hypothetical protein